MRPAISFFFQRPSSKKVPGVHIIVSLDYIHSIEHNVMYMLGISIVKSAVKKHKVFQKPTMIKKYYRVSWKE